LGLFLVGLASWEIPENGFEVGVVIVFHRSKENSPLPQTVCKGLFRFTQRILLMGTTHEAISN
jgi:hypothetical protein